MSDEGFTKKTKNQTHLSTHLHSSDAALSPVHFQLFSALLALPNGHCGQSEASAFTCHFIDITAHDVNSSLAVMLMEWPVAADATAVTC